MTDDGIENSFPSFPSFLSPRSLQGVKEMIVLIIMIMITVIIIIIMAGKNVLRTDASVSITHRFRIHRSKSK